MKSWSFITASFRYGSTVRCPLYSAKFCFMLNVLVCCPVATLPSSRDDDYPLGYVDEPEIGKKKKKCQNVEINLLFNQNVRPMSISTV